MGAWTESRRARAFHLWLQRENRDGAGHKSLLGQPPGAVTPSTRIDLTMPQSQKQIAERIAEIRPLIAKRPAPPNAWELVEELVDLRAIQRRRRLRALAHKVGL